MPQSKKNISRTPITQISKEFEDTLQSTTDETAIDPARSELLNDAIEDMRQGRSPKYFSTDPEFQEAVRFHVSTSDTEINENYRYALREKLVEQFATKQMVGTRFQQWSLRLLPIAAVAVVMVFVVKIVNSEGGANGILARGEKTGITQEQKNTPSTNNTETPENNNQEANTAAQNGDENTEDNVNNANTNQDTPNTNSSETPATNQNTAEETPHTNDSGETTTPTNGVNETPNENTNSNSNTGLAIDIADSDVSNEEWNAASNDIDTVLTTATTETEALAAYQEVSTDTQKDIDLMITTLSNL